MKKQLTLFAMMIFSITVFAQEVIVEWNFPEEGTDSIADGGIAQNLDKPIYTMGGISNLNYKNGATTKAAQATHWEDGAETKCWVVEVNTENYGSLMLSSKMSSGGNDPGPRDFRVDYKVGVDGDWTEVADSEITTANDWETGVLENLPLPEDCSNQPLLFLRWIMTSNMSSVGEPVESSGKLKIDDIIIAGTDISLIGESLAQNILVYPNPFSDYVHLRNLQSQSVLKVFDHTGKQVYEAAVQDLAYINLNRLTPGVYMIQLFHEDGNTIFSKKLLKN